MNALTPSRRAFLQGTAASLAVFTLGTFLQPFGRALAQAPAPGPFDPNIFLQIASDNTVTLISKHFEMGQGVTTGLATLVAEELGADWSQMRFIFAPANPALYHNLLFGPVQATGGTTSTVEAWTQMRQVGAAAHVMFATAAANKWQVPASEVSIENGVVVHGANRATLGSLAEEAMNVPVPTSVTLKEPKNWTMIGRRLPRLDSVMKTTGQAIFALDFRRPGTLTTVVLRPDRFGATVASFDATEARKIDGVVDVQQLPTGIAVYATNTWAAIEGRKALKVTWDMSKAETRSTEQIFAEYRNLLEQPGLQATKRGDTGAALAKAARTVAAEFTFPYLAHAPMEPLNCTIELGADGAEIWSGCQLQTIDQFVASQVLGFKPEQIKINTMLGGGSFGRRGNPVADWVAELCFAVKAIGGRAPVHLVWTREDDIKGGFYRPMALHRVRVGLTQDGRISGWQHQLVSKSIFTGTPFEAVSVKDGLDVSSVEGVADTDYAIPDFDVRQHNVSTPLPVLWWRSVGNSHTAFAMETMIDELAGLAAQDPVPFRLGLLANDPRDVAVVRLAAEKAGWGTPLSEKGRGRGIAFHHSFGTRVAMVSEVTVRGGVIKVDRMVAAVDLGVAVNPDVVVAQVEGAIGFALSMVLRNEITLKNGVVQQSNFDDYEPTRMREMPKVEVHIVPSMEPPTGIGEPGLPPVAPAIANAVAAATGKRLRSLPLRYATFSG
ncbi:xanthine dehydrogenase family protein molybdopterin-binding subunit [Bradyrhizobium sp. AZCC 1693]|uniref:xanthine dehydrogenase family protein molybdopterin-binding subunit n=1 Tax=Bradyrhizobium sp. AZCC 1693 TaxID=3117029 RepID=UPI002FEE931D